MLYVSVLYFAFHCSLRREVGESPGVYCLSLPSDKHHQWKTTICFNTPCRYPQSLEVNGTLMNIHVYSTCTNIHVYNCMFPFMNLLNLKETISTQNWNKVNIVPINMLNKFLIKFLHCYCEMKFIVSCGSSVSTILVSCGKIIQNKNYASTYIVYTCTYMCMLFCN